MRRADTGSLDGSTQLKIVFKLSCGVIGNTSDSGSEEFRFETLQDNLIIKRLFVKPGRCFFVFVYNLHRHTPQKNQQKTSGKISPYVFLTIRNNPYSYKSFVINDKKPGYEFYFLFIFPQFQIKLSVNNLDP